MSRRRQARSISVQTAIPALTAFETSGLLGDAPGETIKRSGLNSSRAFCNIAGFASITDSTPNTSRMSKTSESAASATTRSLLPSSLRVSATEKPVLPKPKTATLILDQLELQLVSCWRTLVWLAIDPLEIEKTDSG